MASSNVTSLLDRKKPRTAKKLGVQRGERNPLPQLRHPSHRGTRTPWALAYGGNGR